jgi:Zn-dependent protease
MLNPDIPTILSRVLTLMIAFSIHEFSHALVATYYGDETARSAGRLTLNPFKHLDVVGTILLIAVGFGWAKPVPINPQILKQKSRFAMMWVSLAGPFSNFLLAVMAAIPLRYGFVVSRASGAVFPSFYDFLTNFLVINLVLMIFNLIPLAPLDGEKAFELLFPGRLGEEYQKIRKYGPLVLIILLFVLPRMGFDLVSQFVNSAIIIIAKFLIGV